MTDTPNANVLSFFIVGVPKPQARPKFARMGKFVRTYSPKTDWYGICYGAALQHRRQAYTGPLGISLTFVLPRPKSAPKRVIWPAVRPDIDNYIKAVMDAFTQAGMWKDDGLICQLNSNKVYQKEHPDTGCLVEIRELEAAHGE